jgi:hypothetical protein
MNNLVWYTGAPGSKWSGVANVLQAIKKLNFNISDRNDQRQYQHVGPSKLSTKIFHTGAYFGPGHGLGEQFHELENLATMEVERQIRNEWSDPSHGNLLVKSHFFSESLDYIAHTWPTQPIIMIFRPNDRCEQGWFGAGGWNISYPNYRPYYKDDATMKFRIAEHNEKMLDFCKRKGIQRYNFNAEYLKNTFNWCVDDLEESQREWINNHLVHSQTMNDVEIAIWNQDFFL